jgi:uncharacterized LabA/DUF88 family protein/cold shock CspA family protein
MLKAGIFIDVENLSRNGGWGIQFNVIKDIVEAQNAVVVRANAYLAIDLEREGQDGEYQRKNEDYRAAIRRNGFHLILKEVRRYTNEEGEVVLKANADLDLAVDALLQSENLDHILLGSGDGDFLRLVRALQNHGKRVDLLSFHNTSTDLRKEVDNHFNGFLIPGLIRSDERSRHGRRRGYLYKVNEEQGYGFVAMRTGLGANDQRYDIFLHINDFSRDGRNVDNSTFAELKHRHTVVEFDLKETDKGSQAVNAVEYSWDA